MEKLIAIVGQENFTNQLEELVPYSYDASMNVHRPDAAVWPESTEQVSKIVEFANEYKIPVVPRGAGTSLSGGVIPIRGGIIIDLSRMNRILEISIENRFARVQAGVVCDDLNRELAKHGFTFPPTLQAVPFPPLGEMWPPTLEESKEPNTAPPETTCSGFRWSFLMAR